MFRAAAPAPDSNGRAERRVLCIAYHFPPMGGIGTQRTLKFARYLPESGWIPVILTAREPGAGPEDRSLLAEVPPFVSVHRSPVFRLPGWLPWRVRNWIARWLFLVDEQLGWLPFAVSVGKRILSSGKIDALFSTVAPFTAHLIALALHRSTRLPWVADFRDLWVGNPAMRFPTPVHTRIASSLERAVISEAAWVTVVSEPMREALCSRYPDLPPSRVVCLPNGYDPADFVGVEPLGQDPARFTLVYAGSFYGARSPKTFFQALAGVLSDGVVPRDRIRVRFVGNIGQAARREISALGLTDVVEVVGYVPHRQSIAYLLGADALLLVVAAGSGSEVVLTGKIFEYLAAAKPILALVPAGPAADLICSARAGTVVDPRDVPAIGAEIAGFYARWCQGELRCTPDPTVVARYDRRCLAAALARLLDEVTRERS